MDDQDTKKIFKSRKHTKREKHRQNNRWRRKKMRAKKAIAEPNVDGNSATVANVNKVIQETTREKEASRLDLNQDKANSRGIAMVKMAIDSSRMKDGGNRDYQKKTSGG